MLTGLSCEMSVPQGGRECATEARDEEDRQSQDKVGEQGPGGRSRGPGDQSLALTYPQGGRGQQVGQ